MRMKRFATKVDIHAWLYMCSVRYSGKDPISPLVCALLFSVDALIRNSAPLPIVYAEESSNCKTCLCLEEKKKRKAS